MLTLRSNKPKISREDAQGRAAAALAAARQRLGQKGEVDIRLKPLKWWRENWADKKIRRQFIENFIKIRDSLNENETVAFRFNDVQAHLFERLSGRDVVLKMRRGGLSTLFQAIGLSNAIMRGGYKVRTVPHDPDTASEFRETIKTMFESLPAHLRIPTRFYNEQRILFETKSGVTTQTVQPKREKKGRGLAISLLHATEVAFWEGDGRKALVSLMSAAEGGEVVLESTANGINDFEARYQDGKLGRGGWTSHFYEWWWRRSCRLEGATIEPLGLGEIFYLIKPTESFSDLSGERLERAKLTRRERAVGLKIYRHLKKLNYIAPSIDYRDDWFRPEAAEYLAWRRMKIEEIGDKDFLIEYPENDRECFENTGRTVIAPQYLKTTCAPQPEAIDGHSYVVAADTSLGQASGDPAAIEVLDLETGRQVYSEELLMSPDLLAYKLVEISDRYNYALIAVERNNTGIATVKKLLELVEPERVYKELTRRDLRSVEDGRKSYDDAMDEAEFGIATTTANKGLYAVYLESAVRTGEIGLSNLEWCDQAQSVVWFDNGTWGALPNKHDDRFMALAIANYVRVQGMNQTYGFVGVLPETGYARAS